MASTETSAAAGGPGADPRLRDQALAVLCADALEPIVEMVVWSPSPDRYTARAVDGEVTFRRRATDGGWTFERESVVGRDPLAVQDPARFSPLGEELANLQPRRHENSYPHAFEHVAQIFDHPCAPDLCALHTAAHRVEHHNGEHGSLGVVQARAPFIVSGAGVRRLGMVDGSCRLVDVAPTVLAILGVQGSGGVGPSGRTRPEAVLGRQDGDARVDLLEAGEPAAHVVGFLLDGANANVLYAAAAAGQAPNVARLIDEGACLRHGAMASLPTVTLANHTTVLTGCHPGHHGVLHNAWFDRARGRQVVTESPTTWQEAMQWLAGGVETIHQALKRARPDACSISVNEPADSGADYSTFELFRRGDAGRLMPSFEGLPPHTTAEFAETSADYRWATMADSVSVDQACGIWSGHFLDRDYPPPTFMWVNTSLTDAAFHEGGPHSQMAAAAVRDTDARIGEVIDAVDRAGVLDRTAFVLVADHGMEQNDGTSGNWEEPLRAAGLRFRDEASGFVYLGVDPD